MQKTLIVAALVTFVAFPFGVLGYRYQWAVYIAGVLAFLACFLGLTSLLGLKRFRYFIVTCGWFGERQESVTQMNNYLSLISRLVVVDFIVDIDGNVYDVANSTGQL